MKRKILIISILILIFTSIFSINASAISGPDYFKISYGDYQEVIGTFDFMDYNLEPTATWGEFVAYFIDLEYGSRAFFFYCDSQDVIHALYDWSESEQNYLRDFIIRDTNGNIATVGMNILSAHHYRLEYVISSEDCVHSLKVKEDNPNVSYCFYCMTEVQNNEPTISDTESDYNNKIAITYNENTLIFPVLGMHQKTWSDYVEAYINYYRDTSTFGVHGQYVTYKGMFLVDPRQSNLLIKATDTIIVAAGGVYGILPLSGIYTVSGDYIYFDTRFDGEVFSSLISTVLLRYPDNHLATGGYYGNSYVYYNGSPLSDGKGLVTSNELITANFGYSIDRTYNCSHDYVHNGTIQEPTCVLSEIYTVKCRKCGNIEERTGETSLYTHLADTIISSTAATCTEPNTDTWYCSDCGRTEVTYGVSNGHQVVCTPIVIETCTVNGNYKYSCTVCGYEYFEDVMALGHDISAATCTEGDRCKTCGEVFGEPLGHSWTNVLLWQVCSRCSESRVFVDDSSNDSTTPGENNANNGANDWWNQLLESLTGNNNNNNNNSFNEEFEEFNENTKQLLTLVMGFCVFLLVFYAIKELIRWIKLKNNRK